MEIYKQITAEEAVKIYQKNVQVIVVDPSSKMVVDAKDLFEPLVFLRREPAAVDKKFDSQFEEPDAHDYKQKMMEIAKKNGEPEKAMTAEKIVLKEASKEKITKRMKLDLPKVEALFKAGWPVKKIADEVGASSPTVYAAIRELGLEKTGKEKQDAGTK